MINSIDVDVIVVGAGAAGLAAALRLAAGGCSVQLIEARNRAGGRIWTVEAPVELGAEFVHGRPAVTQTLLRQAGIKNITADGAHWERMGNRFAPMEDRLERAHALLSPVARLSRDQTVAEYLRHAAQKQPDLTPTAEMIQRLVEQFDAADPARASVTAIAEEWSGDTGMEAPAGRPETGYGGLVNWMVKALDPARVTLRLEAEVTEIAWSEDGVVAQVERKGRREEVRARSALLTVPLAVLQAPVGEPGAIRFDPPLRKKAAALKGLATGPVLKVLLRYDHRFWESLSDGAAEDVAFFHWDEVPFRTIWTAYPARSPWLTAWLAGPRAAELSFESDEVIALRAAESVQRMFAGLVDLTGMLRETRLHNWQRDPRALGAYSYVTVGGASAREELARPLGGVLFFAGEATETSGEACTVAGALMSGERAAQEILSGKAS